MHTIITLATGDFFESGLALLSSWKSAADRLIVYGHEFGKKHKSYVRQCGASFKNISNPDFRGKIMFYKFITMSAHIKRFMNVDDYVSYLDFDTMVVKNWNHVYQQDFDIGFTVRPFARSPVLNTNGGVIFCKCNQKCLDFLYWATDFIQQSATGRIMPNLDPYYTIADRSRIDLSKLRWWVDQLLTSSVVQCIYNTHGKPTVDNFDIRDYLGYKIGMFNCPIYNDTSEFTIENIHDPEYLKNRYIIHFKGRRKNRVYKFLLPEIYEKINAS